MIHLAHHNSAILKHVRHFIAIVACLSCANISSAQQPPAPVVTADVIRNETQTNFQFSGSLISRYEAALSQAKDTLLTVIGGEKAKAVYFCDGLDPNCTLEDALKKHDASGTAQGELIRNATGKLVVKRNKGKKGSTAFLFETEKCKYNQFIFANAHLLYNYSTGKKREDIQGAEVCFHNFHSGNCWNLNLKNHMKKNFEEGIKIWPSKDYMVIPLKKDKKPPNIKPLKLKAINCNNQIKPISYAGFYTEKDKTYTGQQCKTTRCGDLYGNGIVVFHNCPTQEGFSGAPLVNNKNEVIAFSNSQSLEEKCGPNYSDKQSCFYVNAGGGITQELIDEVNHFCETTNLPVSN